MHLASRSDQASNEANSNAALRLDSAAATNRRLSRMHGLFSQLLSNRAANLVARQHRHLMAATASAPLWLLHHYPISNGYYFSLSWSEAISLMNFQFRIAQNLFHIQLNLQILHQFKN